MPIESSQLPKAKRQRADRRKTVEKVAAAVLKKPRATERELAKMAGVGKSSVNRVKAEVGQAGAKDPRIIEITEADVEIVKLAQGHILRELQSKTPMTSPKDISTIAKDSAARYMALRGDATDEHGGARVLTPEQIALLQGALDSLPG
jgi:DNA-binding MurR/RpiR family transcriptional regulator